MIQEYERILYYVPNNFNCICDDCLSEFKEFELSQPSFKEIMAQGECELCGWIESTDKGDV
jgi:hypothetical protein